MHGFERPRSPAASSRHPLAFPQVSAPCPAASTAPAGNVGAGSGAPSYPFTSPNRDPDIQSSRACSMSSGGQQNVSISVVRRRWSTRGATCQWRKATGEKSYGCLLPDQTRSPSWAACLPGLRVAQKSVGEPAHTDARERLFVRRSHPRLRAGPVAQGHEDRRERGRRAPWGIGAVQAAAPPEPVDDHPVRDVDFTSPLDPLPLVVDVVTGERPRRVSRVAQQVPIDGATMLLMLAAAASPLRMPQPLIKSATSRKLSSPAVRSALADLRTAAGDQSGDLHLGTTDLLRDPGLGHVLEVT